ncbi:T9SS type A sorting domain-containing protein [Chitinophaga sp. GbtcB8]|uniref:Ig-like domain-containing protein n=1 Tax=Chitinophaga sp. GbtcB8 TaxID=2824753 RepID=UPI001C2F7F5D|nr:T9SS type A sorting domain-containing protein [Chitinophaga sp. GbtcB8]
MIMQLYPSQRMTWIMAALLCLLFPRTYAQQVYANSQTNGITGLCFSCSVSNPNNAVNNSNLNDYAQLNMGTALGTVTVYQMLIFPSASNGCDSLVIGIGASGSPADNPYTSVTVQTYNGNTANNDAQTVDDNMLRQLQGYGQAEILLKAQQTFDRVRVTLTRQGSGSLTNLRIFYAYRQPGLLPPVVTDSLLSTCEGSTITLHAFSDDPQVTAINWYDAPSGGNLLYTGDYFTLQADSTATYYVTSQALCEFPQRVAVQVTTTPRPPAPVLGVPDTVYAYRFANVTLTATAADSAVIHWYRSDTGTTAVYTGNSYRFTVLTPGTLYFYAGTEQQGCISLRKQVVVIVSTQTTPPAARSAATAVKQQPAALPALQLYPNPTRGELRFTGKDLSGSVAVIRDVNGREVQREVLQRNGLNISRLKTAGIYFIQVIAKDHAVYSGKVLLQR